MTVRELSELYHLNREIEMDRKRIADLSQEIDEDRRRLAEMEQDAHAVPGSGYDGMPKSPSSGRTMEEKVVAIEDQRNIIRRKIELRKSCEHRIREKQLRCLAERDNLEAYIAGLPSSQLRMIYTLRFINGLPWNQVASSIGDRATEDSVKKRFYRSLKDISAAEK